MITRKDAAGKEQKIKVNLKDILKGKKKDLKLQEGDVVYVPESFLVKRSRRENEERE